MTIDIQRQCRFNNHTTLSLYRIMVIGVMNIGNIAPTAGIEPISLAFQASVLTMAPPRLPDLANLPTRIFLCGSLPERSVQTTTVLYQTALNCPERSYIDIYGDCIREPSVLKR